LNINLPLRDEDLKSLKIGDMVSLTGVVYTARDAAHKRMLEMLNRSEELPIDLNGITIYYVGPTPAKPGAVIGSAGPTTSSRMDDYTPKMLELGVKAMIGKGGRSEAVIDAMKKEQAVYFVAVGGAAALLAKRIKKCEIVAFEDLGPEAIYRLEVEDFPVIVAVDSIGKSLFTS